MLRILKLLVVLGLVLAIPFTLASALPIGSAALRPARAPAAAGRWQDRNRVGSNDGRAGVYLHRFARTGSRRRAAGSAGAIVLRCLQRSVSDADSACRSPSLDRIESDEVGMQHVRFNQVVNDVPVFGGQLIVHLEDDRIRAVNGNYFPDVKVDTTPTVSQDAAVALVRADVGDPQAEWGADRSGLVVYVDEGHLNLAWKVNVYSEKNLGNRLYFVDAHANRIAHKLNQARHREEPQGV